MFSRLCIMVALFFIAFYSFTQPVAVEWTKSYNNSILGEGTYEVGPISPDGGQIILNNNPYSDEISDIFLVKIDVDGNIISEKKIGTEKNDRLFGFLKLHDNSFLISGHFDYTVNRVYNHAYGFYDYQFRGGSTKLLKLNSKFDALEELEVPQTDMRELIETKAGFAYTGSYGLREIGRDWKLILENDHQIFAHSIVRQSGDSGYILFGRDLSYTKARVIKTGPSGDVYWEKFYTVNNSDFYANDLRVVKGIGYLLLGRTMTGSAPVLIMIDYNGDKLWEKIISWPELNDQEWNNIEVEKIHLLNDGGFLITGHSVTFNSGIYWLSKISKKGEIEWNFRYEPTHPGAYGSSELTSDGGLIMSLGYSLVKFSGINPVHEDYQLFPNPTEGTLSIAFIGDQPAQARNILVTDVSGQHIAIPLFSPKGNKIEVDVSTLRSGVYFLKVEVSEKDKPVIKRFIKK